MIDFRNKTQGKEAVEVEIQDFTNVPIEVCIERDKNRVKSVGEEVIRSNYDKWMKDLQN